MNNQYSVKIKLIALINLICLCLLIFPAAIKAQSAGGTSKEKLIDLLRSRMYKAPDIAVVIKKMGVNFQLTPEIEKELIAAGARTEVIQAVRSNYRPPQTPKNTVATPRQPRDLPAKSNTNTKPVSNPNYGEDSDAFEKYQNLMQQALYQSANRDAAGAVKTLQQAVQLAPKEAPAYQMLGYIALYAYGNFQEAERNMQKSIDLGGSAVFSVHHDHDGAFSAPCYGSLFVSKDRVTFESAATGLQTVDAQKSNIKQVQIYNPFRRYDGFIINAPLLITFGNSAPVGFAPFTNNIAESQLIARLIGKG